MNLAGINLFTERPKCTCKKCTAAYLLIQPRDPKSPAAASRVESRLSRDAADIAGMSGSEAVRRTWVMCANEGILKHSPKRLACHTPRGFTVLALRISAGLNEQTSSSGTQAGVQFAPSSPRSYGKSLLYLCHLLPDAKILLSSVRYRR